MSLSQRHISQQNILPPSSSDTISETDSGSNKSEKSNSFNQSQNQSQNSTPSYPPEGFIEEGNYYVY